MTRRRSFRWGLYLGAGFGYVMGTKAGRERYEQLRRQWKRVLYSDTFRGVEESLRKKMRSGRGPIALPGVRRGHAPAGFEPVARS